ncbi:MAG: response regulator [Steroidobacteraceae bacterium]
MPDEAPTAATPRRLLIADDNSDAAESLAMLLRLEGHDVTVVANGRQALRAVADVQPEFALLDIGMPDMDGYEVARQLRRIQLPSKLTLIAVTGWGREGDKARASQAGFDYHFTKPIEPDELFELLKQGGDPG